MKIDSYRVLLWIMIPVFSILIISCGGDSGLLTVAYQDRIADAGTILAVNDLSDDERFEFKKFSSGSLTAEALISGNADLATMGDAVAVQLASRYPDKIRILGIHGGGEGRHRLAGLKTNPSVIGVKFGTSTHAALLGWLDYDARLIDLTPGMQLSALVSGEIEALAASEPTPSIALGKIPGLAVQILRNADSRYPIVLLATSSAIKNKMELIEQLIDRIELSSILLNSGSKLKPEYLTILTEATGLEPGVLIESIGFHEFGFRQFDEYRPEFIQLADFLQSQGKIEKLPDWEEVIAYEK